MTGERREGRKRGKRDCEEMGERDGKRKNEQLSILSDISIGESLSSLLS